LHTKLIAMLAAAVALSGCATKPAPTEQAAVDLQNEGIAKTCTPSTVDLAGATPATISMTNDGWCGVFTAEKDGQPFSLSLVKTRPAHGRVYIQPVNRQTRIEYTANTGYIGPDSFTVALRSRTAGAPDTPLRIDVSVTPGEGQPIVAPTEAPTKKPQPPSRRPARRPTAPAR